MHDFFTLHMITSNECIEYHVAFGLHNFRLFATYCTSTFQMAKAELKADMYESSLSSDQSDYHVLKGRVCG